MRKEEGKRDKGEIALPQVPASLPVDGRLRMIATRFQEEGRPCIE